MKKILVIVIILFVILGGYLYFKGNSYESKDTYENDTLYLDNYTYNDEILIVNYLYKSNNTDYNNIILTEDVDKISNIEGVGEYPIYEILTKTTKKENDKYSICKIYDMNNIKKNNGKVEIIIKEIANEREENVEEIQKCDFKFTIDISKNVNESIEYKLDKNIIELDLNKIKERNEIETLGESKIKIQKIINTDLGGLIYLYSDVDLSIFSGKEDEYKTYLTSQYSFEITDDEGKVLNKRESQKLSLALDAKEQILVVDSLDKSKILNIKVYEDNTNTLIGETKIQIK